MKNKSWVKRGLGKEYTICELVRKENALTEYRVISKEQPSKEYVLKVVECDSLDKDQYRHIMILTKKEIELSSNIENTVNVIKSFARENKGYVRAFYILQPALKSVIQRNLSLVEVLSLGCQISECLIALLREGIYVDVKMPAICYDIETKRYLLDPFRLRMASSIKKSTSSFGLLLLALYNNLSAAERQSYKGRLLEKVIGFSISVDDENLCYEELQTMRNHLKKINEIQNDKKESYEKNYGDSKVKRYVYMRSDFAREKDIAFAAAFVARHNKVSCSFADGFIEKASGGDATIAFNGKSYILKRVSSIWDMVDCRNTIYVYQGSDQGIANMIRRFNQSMFIDALIIECKA